MSVNTLLYQNSLQLYANTINLNAKQSGNTNVPPIITNSQELCDNVYVWKAQYAENGANIFAPAPLHIVNIPVANDTLVAANSLYAFWQPPSSGPAMDLYSNSTIINVSLANAPTVGQVLTATSNVTCTWQTPTSGNVISGNSIHSDWADTANALNGIAGNAIHSIWADVANSISGTITASMVAVEKKFNGQLYLTGVETNANTNQKIYINEVIFDNTTESLSVAGAYVSSKTTNQLTLGTTNTTTISATAPSASRTITLHDAGAASNFVLDTGGAMTISNSGSNGYVLTATSATASNWATPAATTSTAIESVSTLIYLTGVPANSTSDQAIKTQAIYINANNLVLPAGQGLVTSSTSDISFQKTTNQINLGSLTGNYTILNSTAPAATRTYTITDQGAAANFAFSTNTPTLGYVLKATGTSTSSWQTPQFTDDLFAINDLADPTKQIKFNAAGTASTATTITSSQTVARTLTLPDATDTLIGRATTDTLTSKTITDNSNNVIARSLWVGSGATSVSTYAATAPTTGQILTASNSTTATWASPSAAATVTIDSVTSGSIYLTGVDSNSDANQTLKTQAIFTNTANGNMTFPAGALYINKTTNQFVLGTTNTTTISAPAGSGAITLTLPSTTDTLVGLATTDTLSSKTLTNNTNNVIARELWVGSGATSVSSYAATAPTTGQVLTATTSALCTWQMPYLQYVRYTLTASEIRGLYASPVTILASPGVGYGYAIAYVAINYQYSTAAFAGGGAVNLKFFTNGANLMGTGSICTTTILATTSNDRRIIYPTAGYTTFLATNQVVRIENDTAAFTGASAAGTLQIQLYYTTINQN